MIDFVKRHKYAIWYAGCIIVAAVRIARGDMTLQESIIGGVAGFVWFFLGAMLAVLVIRIMRWYRIRQLKKHPLYYLVALEQKFGDR